jgi:hypothetical protein
MSLIQDYNMSLYWIPRYISTRENTYFSEIAYFDDLAEDAMGGLTLPFCQSPASVQEKSSARLQSGHRDAQGRAKGQSALVKG